MPLTQSAKKALRQTKKRTLHNKEWKTALKAAIKKALAEKSAASVSAAYQVADKSVKNHIIPKNKAARIKSRLAALLKKK